MFKILLLAFKTQQELDKLTGEYEYFHFDNLDLPFKMFRHLLAAYRLNKELENIDLSKHKVN